MTEVIKSSKWLLWLAVVVIIVAGLYFYKGHQTFSDTAIIKVGYLPIYVDLPLFVAKDHGFFAKYGVEVELKRFESSPNIGTSIINGDIDAGASIATTVVLSTESRDPGKMKIFLVDAENKTNYLSSFVVLNSSGIKTMADLKGKRIGGVSRTNCYNFW